MRKGKLVGNFWHDLLEKHYKSGQHAGQLKIGGSGFEDRRAMLHQRCAGEVWVDGKQPRVHHGTGTGTGAIAKTAGR